MLKWFTMVKNKEVTVKADKIYKRKLFVKIIQISFILLFAIVSIIYFVMYMIYNGRGFTIRVDKDLTNSNIFLSLNENGDDAVRQLTSKSVEYMDNISVNWISPNIDNEGTGTHNGDNYYAYTFYLHNKGDETINYWYEIDIGDVLLNLDYAIRIMVIRNGEKTIYAKLNEKTKEPEKDTVAFFKNEIPVLEGVKNFKPGDKDRFTIVVWIEGDDPDCNNELIGGGIHMDMKMTEERIIR